MEITDMPASVLSYMLADKYQYVIQNVCINLEKVSPLQSCTICIKHGAKETNSRYPYQKLCVSYMYNNNKNVGQHIKHQYWYSPQKQ